MESIRCNEARLVWLSPEYDFKSFLKWKYRQNIRVENIVSVIIMIRYMTEVKLKIMNLMVQNLTIDVLFRLYDDPVEETLHHLFLCVYRHYPDFRPLPLILIFEFCQGNVIPVLESVLDPVEPFPLFLE